MNNSFYYFFSATPQVLGAILALFGVFVIFKIQAIKTELLSIGQVLLNIIEDTIGPAVHRKNDDQERKDLTNMRNSMERSLVNKAIGELAFIITYTNIPSLLGDSKYLSNAELYKKTIDFQQKLVSRTTLISAFTAILIFICLITIPLSEFILQRTWLLYLLFGIVTLGIALILLGLMDILKKSLKEPHLSISYLANEVLLSNRSYLK